MEFLNSAVGTSHLHASPGGPASIATLASGSKLARQAISKLLRVMEKAHLIHRTQPGRESVYRLDPQRLDAAQRSPALISKP